MTLDRRGHGASLARMEQPALSAHKGHGGRRGHGASLARMEQLALSAHKGHGGRRGHRESRVTLGPLGPQGNRGPAGPMGDSTDVWPELHLDFTIDDACAEAIRASTEYSGTVEAIQKQRDELDILLGLPARFMSRWQIGRLKYIIERINRGNEERSPCARNVLALYLFKDVRYQNPMGQWRSEVLHHYWKCEYPYSRWLADGQGLEEAQCGALRQWLPESWIPPTP